MTEFYVGAKVRGTGSEEVHGIGEVVEVLLHGRIIVLFPDSPMGATDGSPEGFLGQRAGWCVEVRDLELIPNLPATDTGD